MSSVIIRTETNADYAAVREINIRAFGQPTEAGLVDALRSSCGEAVSLVAVENDTVVGHILFTPITIDGTSVTGGMGLGPMAVAPEKQRSGIGSTLVREGLRKVRRAGCPFVIVLGHPMYYPKFGFMPASRHGLTSQWSGVPDEAFMILVFKRGVLEGVRGVVRYREEFDVAV